MFYVESGAARILAVLVKYLWFIRKCGTSKAQDAARKLWTLKQMGQSKLVSQPVRGY